MDLRRYHADLPYPTIRGLEINQRQAMLLMDGYSGSISELSTVTQYAYHKIKCINNKELYDTLQGIFLVETHHMELLGDCVNQLGIDPKYNIYTNNRWTNWRSDVINYKTEPEEMILADIEGEKLAVKYYEDTARIIENVELERLLLRLAKDEKLHIEIFSYIHNKYFHI